MSKDFPKVVGVNYQEQRHSWVTQFMQDGKVRYRSFSVNKYGPEEAYKKAVQCRIDNLHKAHKQPRVNLEQISVKTALPKLSVSDTLDALNQWSNHDLLHKLMKTVPSDSNQKKLKLLKTALHCILVDLEDIYPKHTIHDLDYNKLDKCFSAKILDVWKCDDLKKLQPLLDIYSPLFESQRLPCMLEDDDQVMLIQRTALLWANCTDTTSVDVGEFSSDDEKSRLSLSELDSAAENSENFTYQTEVSRLLDIIVNSIYTNREIFIRELVSNASDALEKARLSEIKSNEPSHNLSIRISFDESTISILDSGIGMSKEDMITNLGTIAKSGTMNFLNAIKESSDANLIGQFGVGFYSAFLVAHRVVVQSKRHGHDQFIWESSSSDPSYKIYKDPKGNTIPRGTRVTLFLNEDAKEFLEFDKLKSLIEKYNAFIPHPIYLFGKPNLQPKLSFNSDLDIKPENINLMNVDGIKPESEKADETDKWHHLNDKQPLWLRSPKEISQEEYNNFYKAISGDLDDPLTTIHFRGEGEVEFKALLFIPSKPKSEFLDYSKQSHNVKLYIKRVLVSVDLPNFIPKYMFNLHGIVDCEEMSLNISRETIQHSKALDVVSKRIVRKVLDRINQLKLDDESEEDKDKTTVFHKFWKSFQGSLKVGCYEDHSNRSKILDLLLFHSLKHKDGKLTLDQYIKEATGDNKIIYYASGESYSQIEKIPQLQIFKKKDIDVLFLLDSIDESCLSRSYSYKEFSFKSIQKGKLDLGQVDKDREALYKNVFKSFQSDLKDVLVEVSRVEYNHELLDSPCAVQATEWGMSAQMERVMKSYTVNKFDHGLVQRNKVFQINPEHPIIVKLLELHAETGKSQEFTDAAILIYDTAKLTSGFLIENAQTLSNAAYQFLSEKIKVKNDTLDDLISKNSKLKEASEASDDNTSKNSDNDINGDDIDLNLDDKGDEL